MAVLYESAICDRDDIMMIVCDNGCHQLALVTSGDVINLIGHFCWHLFHLRL